MEKEVEVILIGGSFHREKHYAEYYTHKMRRALPSKITLFNKQPTFTPEKIEYEEYTHYRIELFGRVIENVYFCDGVNPEEFVFNIIKDYFR